MFDNFIMPVMFGQESTSEKDSKAWMAYKRSEKYRQLEDKKDK